MTVITMQLPKVYRELGISSDFTFDTEKVNEGGFQQALRSGIRYQLSARPSHVFAKLKEEGRTPTQEDAQAIIDEYTAALYAPVWPERERAERETVSLEDQCWHEILEPVFKAVGWLQTARKAKAAEPAVTDAEGKVTTPAKPAVEAREARTPRTVIAEHEGSPETAYRAANSAYILALRERDGNPLDDEFLATVRKRTDAGWAAKQKAHKELLRARQKAASAVDAEEGAL